MAVAPAVRYDRGSPEIVIDNQSRDVDNRELSRITAALQKQIDRDFFPLWGWRADLTRAQVGKLDFRSFALTAAEPAAPSARRA